MYIHCNCEYAQLMLSHNAIRISSAHISDITWERPENEAIILLHQRQTKITCMLKYSISILFQQKSPSLHSVQLDEFLPLVSLL